ncbi:MAG: hypothetical protein IPQ07_11760 [Myxococcales bacterium]|nr:hypothetical protein [Myxococcales bacterium]
MRGHPPVRLKTISGRPAFYQLAAPTRSAHPARVALLSELLFAAGAKLDHLPFRRAEELHSADDAPAARASRPQSRWELFTVHMMGTAKMGGDRARA